MDKKPCLVSIQSAFAEESMRYEGTFEISEDRIRISWVQPEEEKGEGDSRFLLSYRIHEKLLKMTRRGAAETDMTFQQGEVTDGVMRTSHGDFDLSMETFFISFFSEEEDEDIQYNFKTNAASDILEVLKATDVNTLTPIEAMQTLYDLKKKAEEIS